MKKTDENIILLNLIFCVSIIISNVVGCKVVDFGFSIFGYRCVSSGGALTYALTFLCTDVIGEMYGKIQANKAVTRGFFMQILAQFLILATQYLPCVEPDMQTAYETLLGQSTFFVIGSICAFMLSQRWDVFIFHRIRNLLNGNQRYKWIWNNVSTMTSQVIDTATYATISCGVGMGWLFKDGGINEMIGMMIGQYILKFVLAIIDTPIFYFLTKERK